MIALHATHKQIMAQPVVCPLSCPERGRFFTMRTSGMRRTGSNGVILQDDMRQSTGSPQASLRPADGQGGSNP